MAKITSKLQVTLPKAIADQYHIRPGDEIDWVPAGEVIRIIPPAQQVLASDRDLRLRLFDQATERQRQRTSTDKPSLPRNRGWKREELYQRGRAR